MSRSVEHRATYSLNWPVVVAYTLMISVSVAAWAGIYHLASTLLK